MPSPEFKSVNSYWDFAHYVTRKARHVLDDEQWEFLQTVLATSEKRVGDIQRGVALWRAQLAHALAREDIKDDEGEVVDYFDVEVPAPPKRMMPLDDRAHEGRANAKGIPYLYCATDMKTAIMEVRPWIGSYVSVGQLMVLGNLKVVDCTKDAQHTRKLYFGGHEYGPEEREQQVWGRINQAFSEPVTRADDVADYATTQVLAEAFRSHGFDGIVYGSKLTPGFNVALFDLGSAKLVNCTLQRVESIDIRYVEAANPYYLYDENPVEPEPPKTSDSEGRETDDSLG